VTSSLRLQETSTKARNALRDVAGENLAFVQLDVTDEAQAKAAVEQAAKQFGRIDVAVNNAGYAVMGNFEELATADVEQQFATNFWGVAYVMRAVLPVMRKQRSGHIINISSVAGSQSGLSTAVPRGGEVRA